MALENPHMYNKPNTTPSTVGKQIYTEYYYKKALVEAAKETFFGQLADTVAMPKHFGKTMKRFHYLPILDDRNINDQGIDAQGVSQASGFIANKTVAKYTLEVKAPTDGGGQKIYFEGTSTGATIAAAKAAAVFVAEGKLLGWWNGQGNKAADEAAAKTAITNAGYTITPIQTADDMYVNYGNLYGSSKDVGVITSKIPALSETGGRVNRVGMKRIEIEGSIEKFGFFDEYTQDSMDFDNDEELEMHIVQEGVKAANEITEDQLQIDLLHAAGVVRYTGAATSTKTLAGSATAGSGDKVTYDDLVKLAIELDNNRCPKNTKVITGSRMIDTRVVNAARYMYIGSELLPSIMKMKDYHNNAAFIPVAAYGDAATIVNGEVGAVGDFRIIVVPEMMHWSAAGAAVTAPDTDLYRFSTDNAGAAHYDVFPMLVVGDGSFSTIGFQTDGKTVKFKITHKKPGTDVADRNDPYGEVGFYSVKWWYGIMVLRPERIALIKTVAEV